MKKLITFAAILAMVALTIASQHSYLLDWEVP